jgi:NADH-quinone oxidoreductase subunit N
VAKVAVFRAATEAGYWFLVLIGVLASVVAAFVYLRVIVLMFMREPEEDTRPDESWLPRVALAVPAVLVVVFGVFPGLIVGFLERAAVLRW